MAIHNIDKNSMDRSAPAPNTHDTSYISTAPIVNIPRPSHGTPSVNYLMPGQVASTQAPLRNAQKTLVQSASILVSSSGSAITTFSVAHNLGYIPMFEAALNDANIAGLTGVSLFLPTFTGASINSLVAGAIVFTSYLYGVVDGTNVYFTLLNATGSPIAALTVTYYLYKQRATGS